MPLIAFLSQVSPALAKDYIFEKFSDKKPKKQDEVDPSLFATNTAQVFGSRTLLDRYCTPLASLDKDHKARSYIEGRLIPEQYLYKLFYTENVLDLLKEIDEYKDRVDEMRKRDAIVIPFYDEQNNLACIQFRFFDGDLRYMTTKVHPDAQKIWGLDQVDWNKTVYVCEGMLDAVFLDNCIAAAGASLMSVVKYLQTKTSDFVLVFDKDYKTNYEVYAQFVKAIEAGYKVVMFDHTFEAKDINAHIQNGYSIPQVREYIAKRTFSGLMAKLELSKFRPPKKRKYGKETFQNQHAPF